MDQKKVGAFLKTLRKERGLTQEQLAEQVSVSNRTVSRWETGSNLPDLDVLIELADLYEVELREILDGGRKETEMDKEMKETVLKAADYEKARLARTLHWLCIAGTVGMAVSYVLTFFELTEGFPWGFLTGFGGGLGLGALFFSAFYTSRIFSKVWGFKQRILGREREEE